MSVKIMAKVWDRAIEPIPKLILLKLADHANDEGGSIYPGNERVRIAAGLSSETTVKNRLRQFKALGVLVEERGEAAAAPKTGRGHRKVWRIDLKALAACFPLASVAEPPNLTELAERRKRGHKMPPLATPERRRAETGKGAPDDQKGGAINAPESSRTVIEPSRARSGDPDGPPLAREEHEPAAPENKHWRASAPAMRKRFGGQAFKLWLQPLIAVVDEGAGGRLILWADRRFDREQVERRFKDKLGRLLNRNVEVVFVPESARHQARQQLEAQR